MRIIYTARGMSNLEIVTDDVTSVRLDGDVSGEEGTLARIVQVEERSTVLRRTADDTDPFERPLVANATQLMVVTALADPRHLHQVLTTLVHNALNHGRSGNEPARVRLRVGLHQRHAVIDCLDRGPGLPPATAAASRPTTSGTSETI